MSLIDFREYKAAFDYQNDLAHYGVKGMKWGVKKKHEDNETSTGVQQGKIAINSAPSNDDNQNDNSDGFKYRQLCFWFSQSANYDKLSKELKAELKTLQDTYGNPDKYTDPEKAKGIAFGPKEKEIVSKLDRIRRFSIFSGKIMSRKKRQ